jgi:predicted metal-binding membrane protein
VIRTTTGGGPTGGTGAAARRAGPPRVLIGVIALAWVVAVAAQMSGNAELLHHDGLAHAGLPLGLTLALFLVGWQLMIVAMMLPSSLPLIRAFRIASAGQGAPGAARAALLGGYALIWSVFGIAAFLGDLGLHRLVHAWPWLGAHPQAIAGSVLILAGAFQFSGLKDRCLQECRHPGPFLIAHYGRGTASAFRLGRAHGLFCLGCCWALMLVGFAVGLASLWWMAALTAIMVYEKTGRDGRRAVEPIGVVLISLGVLTLVAPALSPIA